MGLDHGGDKNTCRRGGSVLGELGSKVGNIIIIIISIYRYTTFQEIL
jgi:hypothetical protein